jgi:hypothetical protein
MAVGRTQAQAVSRSGLCCCQLRAWTWAASPLVAFTSNDRARDVIRNLNPDGFAPLCPRYQGGRPPTFTLSQWRGIKKIAASHPSGCAPPALAPLGCGTCSPPMSRARTSCPGTSSRARPRERFLMPEQRRRRGDAAGPKSLRPSEYSRARKFCAKPWQADFRADRHTAAPILSAAGRRSGRATMTKAVLYRPYATSHQVCSC